MGKNKFKKNQVGSLEDRRKLIRKAKKELALEAAGKKIPPQYTIEQLLEKAQDCIDRFEYELAQKFCQRALEMDSDNVQALETSGTLLLEVGNQEAAKQCFGRAVEVSPNAGYSKYMYLGQLYEGEESVQCFKKGIELMVQEHSAKQAQEVAAACGGSSEAEVSVQDISNAYLSMAEVYMTDCCMNEGAEQKCEECINKAIEVDSDNPEAYQLKASFFLSKDQEEHAKDMIKKSVSLWLPKYKAADKGEIPESEFDPFELTSLSYDTRISTAKILTEVKEYETAIDVLEGLLDENDDVPQVWYMIGWANYLLGEDYRENARFYLNKCHKVYHKVKCDDAELLKHVEELIQEIGPGDENEDNDAVENKEGLEFELDSDEEDDKGEENGINEEDMEH